MPGFPALRIHTGNKKQDSLSGSLVGLQCSIQNGTVLPSAGAYQAVYRAGEPGFAQGVDQIVRTNPPPHAQLRGQRREPVSPPPLTRKGETHDEQEKEGRQETTK